MKFLTNSLCLLIVLFTIGLTSCQNENPIPSMSLEISNERGTWGCGIPCDPIDFIDKETGCNLPNGLCHARKVFPPISIDSKGDKYKLNLTDHNTLSFTWKGELLDCKDDLEKYMATQDNEEIKNKFDLIREHVNTHFVVPNDLDFNKKQMDILNSQTRNKFKSLRVLKGDYKITTKDKTNTFEVSVQTK